MVADILLIESDSATVGDQTAIIRERHRVSAIRQIMEARSDMGYTPDVKLFDRLCDMSHSQLVNAAGHYVMELNKFHDNIGRGKKFTLNDLI